ncbi:MAG TPA: glycosyltransferase family 9 protein [Alphaproteobacteria bacterium]|nr:glycosyltransferase family 9 protein [Alphaproteobacteria bacterium]
MRLTLSIRDRWTRVGLDALSVLTPRRRRRSPRATIGVFLLWGIGDAVLTTPFLHALRKCYPDARIVALGKPWLSELFGDEAVFDEFVTLVPPWTRHSGKYRLWSREWRDFARAAAAVRRMSFDLLVSLRPDPRETALGRLLPAREFAGYALAGGGSWISIDLGQAVENERGLYRGELAARAAEILLGTSPNPVPVLREEPSHEAARKLVDAGYAGGPVMALAFGAAHPVRRWPAAKISETFRKLQRKPGAYLVIESDDTPAFDLPSDVPALRWRGALADLKHVLAIADVLLCADSGPLHVGTAVGCRTVAIFGSGSLGRFAPRGPMNATYAVEPMPCRPCYDNCIYSSPLCMDLVDTDAVAALVDEALAQVASPRIARVSESEAA